MLAARFDLKFLGCQARTSNSPTIFLSGGGLIIEFTKGEAVCVGKNFRPQAVR